jgi:hypothetical protein
VKYFPNCSFLDAQIPSHSFFTWRSLAQARHIIRLGTRWRIGNGSQVNIWKDNWISSSSPLKIISPRQILLENARVCDLIDDDSRLWKSSLIDSIFLPLEAEQIKSIPLHPSRHDSMVWSGTPNGQFSTCSAYQLQAAEKSSSRPQQATSQGPTLFGSHFGVLPSQIKSRCLCGVLANRRFQQKPICSQAGCYLPVHAQFAMMRVRQYFTLYGIVNTQELYGKIPYCTNSIIPYKYLTGVMSWRRFCGHKDSKLLKHFLL